MRGAIVRDERVAGRGGLRQRPFDGSQLLGERRLLGLDVLLCAAERWLSAFLTSRRQLVGLEHPLEHLLLGRAQVLLRGLDLVLHGLVFAVGLDRRAGP